MGKYVFLIYDGLQLLKSTSKVKSIGSIVQ